VPKADAIADMKHVRLRRRSDAGTTLAELLVAAVFSAAAIGGILSATATAVNRIQLMNARAIAVSLVQDQMECAHVSARMGVLTAGTRNITFAPSGAVMALGQTLAGDRVPPAATGKFGATLVLTRTTTLEVGTTDIFKVVVTASWKPTGGPDSGKTLVSAETYMRVPCD